VSSYSTEPSLRLNFFGANKLINVSRNPIFIVL
jgi:hypothetical protein